MIAAAAARTMRCKERMARDMMSLSWSIAALTAIASEHS
jgi:hypothetical protein